MNPIAVIVWIGVAVFAATSILAVKYLAGNMPGMSKENGQTLFRILIAQVVIACVAAFTNYVQAVVRNGVRNPLPLTALMVVEEDSAVEVHDGGTPIYVRAPDVSRARRVTDLQLDTRPDFTTSIRTTIEPGSSKQITLSDKNYRIASGQMGVIDADPKEKQGKARDFVLISMEREK